MRFRRPDGTQASQDFDRRGDAERWARRQETALDRSEWLDPRLGRTTVGEWGKEWLAGRADLKPKTAEAYASLWRSIIEPKWGRLPLNRVAYADAQAWAASLTGGGRSASRVRQAVGLLSHMLTDAVKDGRIARNPLEHVDLPRLPDRAKRYLSTSEVDRLADAAGRIGRDADRLLVLLLAFTGLRWAEAAGLRVRDVDLMRRRLAVDRTLSEVAGRLVETAPKNHQRRSVPIPRFIVDELAAHLAGRSPDDAVFTSVEGAVLRSSTWRPRIWDKARVEAGVPGVTPHDLRHHAVSAAISSGANVLAVARMVGHRDPSITLRVYADLWPDDLDSVADRLDDLAARSRDSGVTRVCPGGGSDVVPMISDRRKRASDLR